MKTYELSEKAKIIGRINLPDQPSERISFSDLKKLEKELDVLFGKVGIDVGKFGNHFKDRINDKRNKKDISVKEVKNTFTRLFVQKKKELSSLKRGDEKVLNDLFNDLNIPFMVQWNNKENEMSIVAKTIMRKKNFKTSNQKIKVKK